MAGKNLNEKEMSTSSGIKVVDESQVMTENQANTDEAPMAVLPLNSSTKLDQEPNPFEQSFSGVAVDDKLKDKLKLPPVASITSPAPVMNNLTNNHANNTAVIGGGILPKEVTSQFAWDTLRTGPLSPSMLQGPANPDDYYASSMIHNKPNSQLGPTYSARSSFSSSAADLQYHQHHHQPVKVEQDMFIQPTSSASIATRNQRTRQQTRSRQPSTTSNRKRSVSQPEEDNQSMDSNESVTKGNRRRSSALTTDSNEDEDNEHTKKKTKSSSKDPEDDEKRKNFLERNRIAALKCRQRKKQWLNNLQAKVEFLTSDNERLQLQSESLKEEIVNLKTLLLAHKECPVAQANGFHPNAIQKSMPSMLSTQMMRQGIPASMMQQQSQPAYIPATARSASGTSNAINTTVPPPSLPSSSSSLPSNSSPISQQQQYQRNMGIPVQSQPANSQQGMMAGGGGGSSSSVLRF